MLFTILVGSLFTIFLVIYFFPYMMALGLGHNNLRVLAVVNLLFGWCIVGWFFSLLWALYGSMGNKGKTNIGRIVFLLALMVIFGYLSAFAVGRLCDGVQDHFAASVAHYQALAAK